MSEEAVPEAVGQALPEAVGQAVPQAVPEFLDPVVRFLKRYCGSDEKFEVLKQQLITSGSLIAGGSILNAVTNPDEEYRGDIDIYTPNRNFIQTYKTIINSEIIPYPIIINKCKATIYCESFLRRNGIRNVYKIHSPGDFHQFDIMSVRNARSPLDVVQNFDFTFCQIWYDGTNVYATHPDHVRNKKGVLQGDYVKLYLTGNKFLAKRVLKYLKKNFQFSLENPDVNITISVLEKCPPTNKTSDEYKNKLATHFMLKAIFSNFWHGYRPESHRSQLAYPKSRCSGTYNDRFHSIMEPLEDDELLANDDGYDTDDYINNKDRLIELASIKRMQTENNVPYTNESKFTKVGLNLLNHLKKYWEIQFRDLYNNVVDLNRFIQTIDNFIKLPGYDMLPGQEGDEREPVYHFHTHVGITKESLEGYLERFISMDKNDDTTFPCYANIGVDPRSCQETITMDEIYAIVSDEFWERFKNHRDDRDRNPRLNSEPTSALVLANTQSEDRTFGNIYHYSVCPFCLQLEDREEGCIYLTHLNPDGLSRINKPYCKDHLLNSEIRERYLEFAKDLYDPDRTRRENAYINLEFCAECGRACVNHAHFNFDGTIITPIDANAGVCSGGGRRELIARMLAIREILRDDGEIEGDDALRDQRMRCSLAAEIAAQDPTMLARGQAILDSNENPELRQYNNEEPAREPPAEPPAEPPPGEPPAGPQPPLNPRMGAADFLGNNGNDENDRNDGNNEAEEAQEGGKKKSKYGRTFKKHPKKMKLSRKV